MLPGVRSSLGASFLSSPCVLAATTAWRKGGQILTHIPRPWPKRTEKQSTFNFNSIFYTCTRHGMITWGETYLTILSGLLGSAADTPCCCCILPLKHSLINIGTIALITVRCKKFMFQIKLSGFCCWAEEYRPILRCAANHFQVVVFSNLESLKTFRI